MVISGDNEVGEVMLVTMMIIAAVICLALINLREYMN